MITKILAPIDGSEIAKKALGYALELAKRFNAPLTLLGVIDRRYLVAQSITAEACPTHLTGPVEEYLKQAVEAQLEEALVFCKTKGVLPEKVIRTGHPVEEITKEAEKFKCDLIVMGSHGKSAIPSAGLGSVIFGVIHKESKIPVLVIRN